MATDPSAFKKAALAALANGGTEAVKALTDAKAQLDASKTTHIKEAMTGAMGRGVSSAGGAEIEKIISRPADQIGYALGRKANVSGLWPVVDEYSAMFDAEANAARAEMAGGGGGGRRGGGGGGGGGRSGRRSGYGSGGGSGSDLPDAYWVNWFEEGGPMGNAYDLFGSQSKNENKFWRYAKAEGGGLLGPTREVAKGYGAPRQTRIGNLVDQQGRRLPTVDQLRSGAKKAAPKKTQRAVQAYRQKKISRQELATLLRYYGSK